MISAASVIEIISSLSLGKAGRIHSAPEKTKLIKSYCQQFNLTGMAQNMESVLQNAQSKQLSYTDCLIGLFQTEARIREEKSLQRQLKVARMPLNHNLDNYDYTVENGTKFIISF